MTNAINRDRDVQKVKRVNHPVRRVRFRTSDEYNRQIVQKKMKLHELAYYMSAYEVPTHIISVFEAMLIRSFANDILNVRTETFGKSR